MAMSVLFEPLPKASLAAIIVVALKGLFMQMGDCRKFWRINKFDFMHFLSLFCQHGNRGQIVFETQL
jgi:MFS superfamily sulfate permease-like transporter